jgi:uncharacterized protein (DUF2147 family)
VFNLLVSAGIVVAQASTALPIEATVNGLWRTQMHGAVVKVSTCANRAPCAHLVHIDPALARGVTQDLRNPDPRLRARPLVGVPIVWGLRQEGGGWTGGRVYNPETGQIFRSSMQPLPGGRLRVTGCWGPLCRSETWVRVNDPKALGV